VDSPVVDLAGTDFVENTKGEYSGIRGRVHSGGPHEVATDGAVPGVFEPVHGSAPEIAGQGHRGDRRARRGRDATAGGRRRPQARPEWGEARSSSRYLRRVSCRDHKSTGARPPVRATVIAGTLIPR
jgi:hypothetical protein